MVSLNGEALLISADVAEALGTTQQNVAYLRNVGKGPKYIKVAGVYLYLKSDVQSFAQTYKKKGAK